MSKPRTTSHLSAALGPNARQRGFTLIELMVATLLLMIVMAGFIPVFLSGLANASRDRYRGLATNLAQEGIEQTRRLDYREITDATYSQVVRGATFQVQRAVETYTPTGASQPLKKVTVTVSWGATPAPSPIVVSTMIDQMYLGPRGSWLEIVKSPSLQPLDPDPSGTPFRRASGAVQVRYHVARADWGLVLVNVANPAAGVHNVYMRLAFADDNGVMIAAGDPANDYKVDKTHVYYTVSGGVVTDVYFRWDIAKIDDYYGQVTGGNGLLPDGYWDAQAAMYNAYDQPGNVWRLRVRVMGDFPGTPTLVATPVQRAGAWDQVVLTWTPGAERDRDHFVLRRSGSGPPLDLTLDKLVTTYTDNGSATDPTDPWGDDTHTNYYTYSVHSVDLSGFSGGDGTASVEMPPPPTTTTTVLGQTTTTTVTPTTTTSTTSGTTTTTTPVNWVQVNNNTNQSWTVTIRNSSNVQMWSGTIAKNTIQTIQPTPTLPAGVYSVTGTRAGHTVTATFTMPDQAGTTVLNIN